MLLNTSKKIVYSVPPLSSSAPWTYIVRPKSWGLALVFLSQFLAVIWKWSGNCIAVDRFHSVGRMGETNHFKAFMEIFGQLFFFFTIPRGHPILRLDMFGIFLLTSTPYFIFYRRIGNYIMFVWNNCIYYYNFFSEKKICLLNICANIMQHKKLQLLSFYSTRPLLSENYIVF